jgi:Type II CAAX prenyl endopeptidase Rce1-like
MKAHRAYLESALLVLVWMAAGWALHLDGNSYLLLGVPLVAAFQLLVRRQGLQRLWAREADSFRLDGVGVLIALGLLVVPSWLFVVEALPSRNVPVMLWFVCCLAGAIFAAFALRHQSSGPARLALPSFGIVIVIGCLLLVPAALAKHRSPLSPLDTRAGAVEMLRSLSLYFPVCFVLEEVVFRGAIDSHLFRPSKGPDGRSQWPSAFFVSFLWGIWHLPIVSIPGVRALPMLVVAVVGVHTAVGVPLSVCWRRGGTLVLPALAHALIDAYRNALLG